MKNNLPFNLKIPSITKQSIARLPAITSANVFTGATKVLDPDGLFSTEMFGRVGEEKRFDQFGTIHLRVKIFHPQLFKALGKLKVLYKNIMLGRSYALWDDAQKDFIPASEMEGDTGISFFMRHWKDIEFEQRKSLKRKRQISMIEQYKDNALSEYVLVLPPGMRDVQIDEDGRVEEDEINGLYRRLIMISSTIPDTNSGANVLDTTRMSLQNTFNDIYDLLFTMLKGKNGFYMSKLLSRRIANGTRNVMTALNIEPESFGDPRTPSVTDTQVGLYQTARGLLPITIAKLMDYLSPRFNRQNNTASLYDPKTLKRVTVELDDQTMDKYSTTEGIDKFINRYRDPENRHRDVMIKKYAVGLIYVDDKANFTFVDDVEELPEGLDRKWVRPISLCELLYLCNYRNWGKYNLTPTRYPITGEGSTYPSKPYVKTTIQSDVRYEIDFATGERYGDDHRALEFPRKDSTNFLDSLIVHTSRIRGLGADYDGDTASGDFAYSKESQDELRRVMGLRRFYVSSDGSLRTGLNVGPLNLFLTNFTGEYT